MIVYSVFSMSILFSLIVIGEYYFQKRKRKINGDIIVGSIFGIATYFLIVFLVELGIDPLPFSLAFVPILLLRMWNSRIAQIVCIIVAFSLMILFVALNVEALGSFSLIPMFSLVLIALTLFYDEGGNEHSQLVNSIIIHTIIMVIGFILYRSIGNSNAFYRDKYLEMFRHPFLLAPVNILVLIVCIKIKGKIELILFEHKKNQDDATIDGLTGLLNRATFNEVFIAGVEEDNHMLISLILLDIDHFKGINDCYGHQCGDFILTSVASLIKNTIKEQGEAYRVGGEEFAIIVTDKSEDEVLLLVERLRKRIENKIFAFSSNAHRLTISAGIIHSDGGRHTSDEMYSNADEALYEAKEKGRNRTVVYVQNQGV